jgi:hypothetical protein
VNIFTTILFVILPAINGAVPQDKNTQGQLRLRNVRSLHCINIVITITKSNFKMNKIIVENIKKTLNYNLEVQLII